MPTADLERRVRDWLGAALYREEDEPDVHFMARRWAVWKDMVSSDAWGDFAGLIVKARDGIVRDLVAGTPNRFQERGDDEKRAMIHAFNTVLDLPLSVERDAHHAAEAIRKYQELQAR